MKRIVCTLVPLAFAVVVGCEDPPPPSLHAVHIYSVSNPKAASLTYNANDVNIGIADASLGIKLADGLSIAMTLFRSIGDPPTSQQDADKLQERTFKLQVIGDVFTAVTTNDPQKIVLSSVKLGTGSLVFTEEGLTGSVTMPVEVVDQNAVPPDVHPPGTTPPPETVADAGSD